MRIVAFDCSTSVGSVAVLDGGEVRFSEAFDCPRGRGGTFFEALDRAVRCGNPDRVAVGVGPGSYNGLRTAITAAEALAFATGADRVGIVSLLALPVEEPEFLAIADARGGAFSFAHIRNRELIGEIELLPVDNLAARVNGLPVVAPVELGLFPDARVATPDAVELARIAMESIPTTGRLEPLYLKPAHITQPRNRTADR